MPKRKPKITPISAKRQATFDRCGVSPHRHEAIHAQLCNDAQFKVLRDSYAESDNPPPFTGDREHDGNLIIEAASKAERAFIDRHASKARARNKHAGQFFQTFNRPLGDFWEGSVLGFDLIKFDREIVKSGDRSMTEVIAEQWGKPAVTMIEELLHGVPAH